MAAKKRAPKTEDPYGDKAWQDKKRAAPPKSLAKSLDKLQPKPAKAPRKSNTSSASGEAEQAHQWLIETQKEALAETPANDEPAQLIESVSVDGKPVVKDAKTGQFQKGNKSGGRKKGSRGKLAEEFINDFYAHWLENGQEAINWVFTNKPDVYFKGAIAVLPKQVDVKISEFQDMSDELLDQRLQQMQKELSQAMAILNPKGGMQ